MDQKTQFIADYLRETFSVSELCDHYGVSRKTGYKWIDRYLTLGPAGLDECSRRPRECPRQTPEHVVEALLEARRRHPSWGGKKLLTIVRKRHPDWPWPHRSTIYDILNRHGLVAPLCDADAPWAIRAGLTAASMPPTRRGAPISRGTSRPGTGSTVIR